MKEKVWGRANVYLKEGREGHAEDNEVGILHPSLHSSPLPYPATQLELFLHAHRPAHYYSLEVVLGLHLRRQVGKVAMEVQTCVMPSFVAMAPLHSIVAEGVNKVWIKCVHVEVHQRPH